MDDRAGAERPAAHLLSPPLVVAGLGPGTLARTPGEIVEVLLDPAYRVILRTERHPAAAELAQGRRVITCDDLYDAADSFEDVYAAIVERVLRAADAAPTVYAVPGSPLYGERSVAMLRERCRAEGRSVRVCAAPSFVDAVFDALSVDPTEGGFTVLDGRDLPDPLMLHLPTVVFQVDTPVVLADALARIGRTLPSGTPITVLSRLGAPDESVAVHPIGEVPSTLAGSRTSLYIDPPDTGMVGAITAMRRLRVECPWDRRQTHDSLAPYAVEETFELLEAISHLPPGSPGEGEPDYPAYAEVEEELGDLLLQVIFHANLASEVGAFDVEDVAETLRRKLVHRHPHVFGDTQVEGAEEVMANWWAIKEAAKPTGSRMDGIPGSIPGLERAIELQQRAARVGFDWPDARSVVGDVEEELDELVEVIDRPEAADELGDLLFAVANLARHLDVGPEMALRRANARFESRFRRMEELEEDLKSADLARLDALWEQAKREE